MANIFSNLFSKKKAAPTQTIGAGGTAVYAGGMFDSEVSSELSGTTKYKTYSQVIANTNIAAAGIRYFLNVLGKSQWKFEPAEGDGISPDQAEMYAELTEDIFHDMRTPWKRVVRRGAMYRFHGFSVQEWTAKRRDDGHFGFLDVEARPQITIEEWDIDISGTILGLWQSHPNTMEKLYIPRNKFAYLVDDSINDSPEGLGLLRNIVAASKRLERYEQLEGFGFETDLRGIPIGRIPYQEIQNRVRAGTLTEAQAKEAVSDVEKFVTSHIKNPALGMTLDSSPYQSGGDSQTQSSTPKWDLQLLSGEGGNFEAVAASIERINHEIARVLGVEHLLLGQSRGTQALSHDKSENFGMVVDSALDELACSYQDDLVDRLFEINGWDKDYTPTLKPGRIQFRDITKISSVVRDMATAGAVILPDDPIVGELRDELGFSRPPETAMEDLEDASIPQQSDEPEELEED